MTYSDSIISKTESDPVIFRQVLMALGNDMDKIIFSQLRFVKQVQYHCC